MSTETDTPEPMLDRWDEFDVSDGIEAPPLPAVVVPISGKRKTKKYNIEVTIAEMDALTASRKLGQYLTTKRLDALTLLAFEELLTPESLKEWTVWSADLANGVNPKLLDRIVLRRLSSGALDPKGSDKSGGS